MSEIEFVGGRVFYKHWRQHDDTKGNYFHFCKKSHRLKINSVAEHRGQKEGESCPFCREVLTSDIVNILTFIEKA